MGRRGPAPTPTAILKARGSPRGKYGREQEPQPQASPPQRPRGLTGTSAKIWDVMVGVVAAGVLTRDNGQTLSRYCHGLARWWKLADWLDNNDDTYEVEDKLRNVKHVRHPNVITYEKLGVSLLRMEQEFGLTPAARARVDTILAPSTSTTPSEPKRDPAQPPAMRLAAG